MNKKTLKNLIDLDIYEMSFDENDETIEGLEYEDSNNNMRKIKENGMSIDDIKFHLLTEQTKLLKSINGIMKFFFGMAIATIIILLIGFFNVIQ